MVPDKLTRREALQLGAGTVAATSLSGCSSALPPLGSQLDFGRVDVPDADDPTYRQWLPTPSVAGADREHYNVLFRRPSALDYRAPVRFTTPKISLLTDLDYFGVGYANYDRLLWTRFGIVLEGAFKRTEVADTLTYSGYTADGTYHEYDLFTRADEPRTVALGDGALVYASERVHEDADVQALLDAKAGRIDRYHEVAERFARASDAIGESRMVEFLRPNGARSWLKAEGFRFDGETAYHVVNHLYPDGEPVPTDRLKQRSVQKTLLTREVDAFDYSVDGQLATVMGRVPAGEGVDPATATYPPQITWGSTEDPDGRALALRHEAGEDVDASALQYELQTRMDETVQSGAPWTDTDTVSAGDTATVTLAESATNTDTTLVLRYVTDAAYGSLFAVETGGDG